MHNPFDHLAKRIGRAALALSGLTSVHHEIARDAQHADLKHEPDPKRQAERARLGLLGRLASVLCIIEVFGHALSAAELRACLSKHFDAWEQQARKLQAQNRRRRAKQLPPEPMVEPFLWILVAVMSEPMKTKLKLDPAPDYPPGVYFFGNDLFRVGIVIASELPRERSTLLVRLMAAGPGLKPAIEELAALPRNAHERTVTKGALVNLRRVLGEKPSRTLEEEEIIVLDFWEEAHLKGRKEGLKEGRKKGRDEGLKKGRDEGLKKGRDEGLKKGRAEEAARALLTVLRVRGLAVPDDARERILAEKDPERLEQWHERAIVAASLAEVLEERS